MEDPFHQEASGSGIGASEQPDGLMKVVPSGDEGDSVPHPETAPLSRQLGRREKKQESLHSGTERPDPDVRQSDPSQPSALVPSFANWWWRKMEANMKKLFLCLPIS